MITLRALVTGASGFVGSYLVEKLARQGAEVLGISRTNYRIDHMPSTHYLCDIMDKERLKKIIEEFKPNAVYHLAGPAYIPSTIKRPWQTFEVIVGGTLNLLECLNELDIDCKTLYVSSADVYGEVSSGDKFVEELPYKPINPYASSKASAELLCKQFFYTYGMDIVIARPFNHTGPGQSSDFVCSNFAMQIATMISQKKQPVLMTGNIDVKRDFLDVRDVVNAYYQLLLDGKSGEVYNVSSGESVLLRQVIEWLFEAGDINEYQIITDQSRLRNNEIFVRVGSNHKIKQDTSWCPRVPLNETMKELINYWRGNVETSR